jgi:hypothetical protein
MDDGQCRPLFSEARSAFLFGRGGCAARLAWYGQFITSNDCRSIVPKDSRAPVSAIPGVLFVGFKRGIMVVGRRVHDVEVQRPQ